MNNSLSVGLSHQLALRRHMDIIANNLANMNTTGFRGESPVFQEVIEQVTTAEGVQDVAYVLDMGINRNLSEGPQTQTGAPLDFAIQGNGYFQVETEAGPRFTRDGHFSVNENGELVNRNGHLVLSNGGAPINLGEISGQISVTKDGTITVGDAQVGQIGVVEFEDERELSKAGESLYASEEDPRPVANANILQGFVENSNVIPIKEMTEMMQVMRSYKSASDLMSKNEEALLNAIRTLGREA